MTKEIAEKAPLRAYWGGKQPPNSTQKKFLSKKGVYRHLSAYASDSQSVTGDGKVMVTCIFGKWKSDVADNEDERLYLPSPFWYEGQNACRNGKK